MGFIDDKNSIVQQISVFEVLGNLPDNRVTSSIESVTSKSKNLLPFMLDLLTLTCKDDRKPRRTSVPSFQGTSSFLPSTTVPPQTSPRINTKCELTRIILEILVDFFPVLIQKIKEGVIKAIKAGLVCPADFTIPSPPPTVTLNAKDIDYNKLMKVDPNTFPGNLLFGDPETDLNLFMSNLIQNGGTDTWKNLLDFNYNQSTELLDVSINSSYVNQPFDVFLIDYINSIELLSFDNLLPNLMNQLFGSIDASLPNFDIESSIEKEKTDELVNKVLDSDPCQEEFIFDDSFFEFPNDSLLEIEKRANNRKSGYVLIDYGCSPYLSAIDVTTLQTFSEELQDNPPSQAKRINREFIETLSTEATEPTSESTDSEQQKKSFSVKMTYALPKLFTDVMFTPKIVVLYQVAQKMVTNITTDVASKFDYAKANKVFFEYVIRESMAALLEIIFNQIKEEIIKLVTVLAIRLIKEAAEKRVNQLLSLVGGFSASSGISASIPSPPDVSDLSNFS